MRWAVIAPFFSGPDRTPDERQMWIDDFDNSGQHSYVKVPVFAPHGLKSWHDRKGRATPFRTWLYHWRQARRAWRPDCSGVITIFPQLAMMAAIQKAFSVRRSRAPILAWCFNVGKKPFWLNAFLARVFLRQIDHFVVHSQAEIQTLNCWFGIPKSKISFVHLQQAPIALTTTEDRANPFLVAMGSANRDYATLIEAVRGLELRLIIIASPRSLSGLDIPETIEVVSGLTPEQCRLLAQRARINVVPLADVATASGQVTIVEALRMGRPLVATRAVGSVDYIVDGESALLVEASDPIELKRAILQLWNDFALRQMLSRNALIYAEATLSDEVAASKLSQLLCDIGSACQRA